MLTSSIVLLILALLSYVGYEHNGRKITKDNLLQHLSIQGVLVGWMIAFGASGVIIALAGGIAWYLGI